MAGSETRALSHPVQSTNAQRVHGRGDLREKRRGEKKGVVVLSSGGVSRCWLLSIQANSSPALIFSGNSDRERLFFEGVHGKGRSVFLPPLTRLRDLTVQLR